MSNRNDFQQQGVMAFVDFPTIPDPEGTLNSHGDVRQVRVCDCERFTPSPFATRAEAEAATEGFNHVVIVDVFR